MASNVFLQERRTLLVCVYIGEPRCFLSPTRFGVVFSQVFFAGCCANA